MSAFGKVCVFCGSSCGSRPIYRESAANLGQLLAKSGIELVYGGGHVGLMGALADGALNAGGRVTGVMPQALIDREVGHKGLTEMHIVRTMHERKALMAQLADAFIAMPGGHGTLDEFCEILTWAQLGIHERPCGILNVNGYYDPLLSQFNRAVEEGFLKPQHRDMVVVERNAEELLKRLDELSFVPVSKWVTPTAPSAIP